MPRLRMLRRILSETGADKLISSFLGAILMGALVIWLIEPQVNSYGDALWYCYAVVTTVGFGDITVVSPISKSVSVLLSIWAVLVIAIVTGVVVNYYTEIAELRKKDTITAFLDKLENLPELGKEELKELSKKVKQFRNR